MELRNPDFIQESGRDSKAEAVVGRAKLTAEFNMLLFFVEDLPRRVGIGYEFE